MPVGLNQRRKHHDRLQYSGVAVLTIKGGKVVEGRDFLFAMNEQIGRLWGESKPTP